MYYKLKILPIMHLQKNILPANLTSQFSYRKHRVFIARTKL